MDKTRDELRVRANVASDTHPLTCPSKPASNIIADTR